MFAVRNLRAIQARQDRAGSTPDSEERHESLKICQSFVRRAGEQNEEGISRHRCDYQHIMIGFCKCQEKGENEDV